MPSGLHFLFSVFYFLAAPVAAYAQFPDQIESFEGTAQGQIMPVLLTVANILLGLVGLVAAIFIILAGIRYIMADDTGEQQKAKNSLIYAVIGLIVIGLSAAIVNITVSAVRGQSQFQQDDPLEGFPIIN